MSIMNCPIVFPSPWAKPDEVGLMDDPKIKTIAEKYKKSSAQVLIKYQACSA